MLQWYELLIVLGYEVLIIGLALWLVRIVRRDKDLEPQFDGLYFLTRWSLPYGVLSQVGLVGLLCILFWTRPALSAVAVGITTLIGIPGIVVVGGLVQSRFFRRYNRLTNLLRRLEQFGPSQRAALLESLPPEILRQIPGDYRIISWEQDKKR